MLYFNSEIVIGIFYTLDNNLEIKNSFTNI